MEDNLFITGECGLSPRESVPASFGSTILPCKSGKDMFVMSVDTAGDVQWATDNQRVNRANLARRTVDYWGNVYEAGRAGGRATIKKFTGEGTHEWTREWHGKGDESSNSVAVDPSGNAYVLGHFSERINMGGYELSGGGSCSTFINKMTSIGDVVWSVRVQGSEKVVGYSIVVDAMGSSYVTGVFEGILMYGTEQLKSVGGQDVFVMKLDTYGNVLWAMAVGGAGQDSGNSIVVDSSGDMYVTGSFSGLALFGDIPLQSEGDLDVFWMKLSRSSAMS